jgi:hypothetical protein
VTHKALMSLGASVLPGVGIALTLANWYAKPEGALVWVAALVMLVVMAVAPWYAKQALRRASGAAGDRISVDTTVRSVTLGALTMGLPLAATLVLAYGLADDPDMVRRGIGVFCGGCFVLFGNVMPKRLPPLASMRCDGARLQTLQRFAGWAWVLVGLTQALAWMSLPVGAAATVTAVSSIGAMALYGGLFMRLRKVRPRAA